MFQADSLNEQESFNICGANVSLADLPMCPFWDSLSYVSYLMLNHWCISIIRYLSRGCAPKCGHCNYQSFVEQGYKGRAQRFLERVHSLPGILAY